MKSSGLGRIVRDGDWMLFDYDFQTGRSTWIMEDGEKTIIRHDYPVAKAIEENAAFRNATPDGWKGDWHRVASIPLNLLHDEKTGLLDAHLNGDDKYLAKFLNDSDNRAWRTKEGKL